MFAADVDGDGGTDALSASMLNDTIAWYENDGGSPPAFTEWVVSLDVPNALFATDLDGDGDTDVLSNAHFDRELLWYENVSDPVQCADVAGFRARCNVSGNLAVRVTLRDATHAGETVTIGVDGTPHVLTVVGKAASYTEPGIGLGSYTITLDAPAACFEAIDVDCPAAPVRPPMDVGSPPS